MKFNKYLVWAIAFFPLFATVGSGMGKILQAAPVVENLNKFGFGPYIMFLGILELVIAILYFIPATMAVGFFLACSYFGGAIAVDLGNGGSPLAPIIILTFYWVATFMRKSNLFLYKQI